MQRRDRCRDGHNPQYGLHHFISFATTPRRVFAKPYAMDLPLRGSGTSRGRGDVVFRLINLCRHPASPQMRNSRGPGCCLRRAGAAAPSTCSLPVACCPMRWLIAPFGMQTWRGAHRGCGWVIDGVDVEHIGRPGTVRDATRWRSVLCYSALRFYSVGTARAPRSALCCPDPCLTQCAFRPLRSCRGHVFNHAEGQWRVLRPVC